jgi:hypothetical protein
MAAETMRFELPAAMRRPSRDSRSAMNHLDAVKYLPGETLKWPVKPTADGGRDDARSTWGRLDRDFQAPGSDADDYLDWE